LGHTATPRFPSPLIKPDVPISSIRLSDWLHCRLTEERCALGLSGTTPNFPNTTSSPKRWVPRECTCCRRLSSPYSTAFSGVSGSYLVFSGSSPITSPSLLPKHARSKGPSLHRHYPASSVLWPSPTPHRPLPLQAAFEGATSDRLRVSPSYSNRLLHMPCSLPRWTGSGAVGSTSLSALAFPEQTAGRRPQICVSRPAQASCQGRLKIPHLAG